MALEWRVLDDGSAAVVSFAAEDAGAWREFQTRGYGVPTLPPPARAVSARDAQETSTKRRRTLSLQEAYQAAAFDNLLVTPKGPADLWQQFTRSTATFPQQFVVFHHFRCLGWLLKPGLNYGAPYVLYRGSATAFHSEYIVYVQDGGESPTAWHTIQALTRIAADVKKTVLLCDVSASPVSTSSTPASEAVATDSGGDASLTHGMYSFHGVRYTLEAVAIRFWDASAAAACANDSLEPYAFQPQPILLKKARNAKTKTKTKRPKRTNGPTT